MKTYIALFSAVLFFSLTSNTFSQIDGWSNPVVVDSTRALGSPLITVSPKGQIAVMTFNLLYISNDNGKSFQLKYTFEPPVEYYWSFTPNGLAYDSNSVLWVYWAWDECSDDQCTFSWQMKLYLSRSTDGGNSFEHVLQFNRGFLTGQNSPHDPFMKVGKDNTIHFLRDSLYDNGSFLENILIYCQIPQGNLIKREEKLLPSTPDSLGIVNIHFNISEYGNPIIVQKVEKKHNTLQQYILFTKLKNDSSYAEYSIIDSIYQKPIGLNTLSSISNSFFIKYYLYDYRYNSFTFKIVYSFNNGDSLSKPGLTTEEVFNINHAYENEFYAINYSFAKQRIMYYKFIGIFSAPTDSVDLGIYQYLNSCIDNNGGKYILYMNQSRTYFIGKDIITGLKSDYRNVPQSNEVHLSVSPNPFNYRTIISFSIPKKALINIILYNIKGEKVQEMKNISASSGENKITIQGDDLASGTYIISLFFENKVYSVKVLLVK